MMLSFRRPGTAVVLLALVAAGLTACRGGSVDSDAATGDSVCPATVPGLTSNSITLGGTYPLSGTYGAYGQEAIGAEAWFKHLNDAQGGFKLANGQTLKIVFKYKDDAYAPQQSLANVKSLVENDNVFMIFNSFGTNTSLAIRDYLNQQKVPQLFTATGASAIAKSDPKYPWTGGFTPSYYDEGRTWATYLLQAHPDAKIGVVYQNNEIGTDTLGGLKDGLGSKASAIVSAVSYETTDATLNNQVSQVKASGADVFVAIASGSFAPQAIKQAAALGWKPKEFLMPRGSSSVAATINPAGPQNAIGLAAVSYQKDPSDPAYGSDPGVTAFKEVQQKYAPNSNVNDGNFEGGVLVAQLLQNLVEGMKQPLCRQTITDAARTTTLSSPLFLPGIDSKMPISKFKLQKWTGTKFELFGDVINVEH
ncbi:ABC transporter substrate-binding protein [Dactylosporangium sp. NPDC051485]|uniref:ABC transporter substrate-binding protein n=1 Tax=Dactylosporangium sp. NPDC051485 TaxID=3154846 RepID=UPI0034124D79